MKRIFLILAALAAAPAFSLQPSTAASWSWKSMVSSVRDTLREKPVIVGLGAAALMAAAYGVYNFWGTKKSELSSQGSHSKNVNVGVPNPADKPNQQEQLKKEQLNKFLSMLKKSAEKDLFRLECMLKENMAGSVLFDCLYVWNAHKELAQTLPLIQPYTFNIKQFSDVALTTQQDVQHAYAHVKSLHRAVEKLIQN